MRDKVAVNMGTMYSAEGTQLTSRSHGYTDGRACKEDIVVGFYK